VRLRHHLVSRQSASAVPPRWNLHGDKRGEPERPERATVVGHQDHRGDLTGLCIG
jgi:hypothetical protein